MVLGAEAREWEGVRREDEEKGIRKWEEGTRKDERRNGREGWGGRKKGRERCLYPPPPPFGDISNGRLLLSSHEDLRRDAGTVLLMDLLPFRSASRIFSLSSPLYLPNSVLSGVSVRQRQDG